MERRGDRCCGAQRQAELEQKRVREKKKQHRNEEEGIRRGMGEELILHSAFIVL